MSGGHFNYDQRRIDPIADDIQREIDNNGRLLTEEERKDYFLFDGEKPTHHYEYPEEVIAEFKKGVEYLRLAAIYAQRIDWLLSGDDGEESFLERLKEELDEYRNA
jgi:hypothetical protein